MQHIRVSHHSKQTLRESENISHGSFYKDIVSNSRMFNSKEQHGWVWATN